MLLWVKQIVIYSHLINIKRLTAKKFCRGGVGADAAKLPWPQKVDQIILILAFVTLKHKNLKLRMQYMYEMLKIFPSELKNNNKGYFQKYCQEMALAVTDNNSTTLKRFVLNDFKNANSFK